MVIVILCSGQIFHDLVSFGQKRDPDLSAAGSGNRSESLGIGGAFRRIRRRNAVCPGGPVRPPDLLHLEKPPRGQLLQGQRKRSAGNICKISKLRPGGDLMRLAQAEKQAGLGYGQTVLSGRGFQIIFQKLPI